MMDMGSFTMAARGLKAAVGLIDSLLKLKISSEAKGKIAELQRVIISAQSGALAAQSDQLALLDDVRELKSQMAKLKAWDREKKRYELHGLYRGTFAYALKKEKQSGEPFHYICTDCYENGKKTILQGYDDSMNYYMLKCHVCKTEIIGMKPENQPR